MQQDLAEAPLLRDLQQQLLRQLPQCSNDCWSRAAFACSIFVQLRCFTPSAEFLAALEAELLSRLASAPEQVQSRFLRACVTEVLHTFVYCAWPVSALLQDRVADWLLGRGGAGERGLTRNAGGAQTLTPRQAEKVLRAWVMIAVTPGAPARAALLAVLQALEAPLAALPKLGGAAGVLARALTIQLNTAPSVQVRPGLAGPSLQTACRGAGTACLALHGYIYVWSCVVIHIYIYIYGYALGAHSRPAGRMQLYMYGLELYNYRHIYAYALGPHPLELQVACSAGLVCAAVLNLSRRISAFTLGPGSTLEYEVCIAADLATNSAVRHPVQVIANIWQSLGMYFAREQACAAIYQLARLCAPACCALLRGQVSLCLSCALLLTSATWPHCKYWPCT